MNSQRRPSFCLYATGFESHLALNSLPRSSNGFHGGELGNVARVAKERLNEKLRTQRTLEINRHNSMGSGGDHGVGVGPTINANVQREVFSKKLSRKFNWSKMGWKSLDQKDCAICLEEFKTGDDLVHLPCSHRFHWSCGMPWIESNSHCPCCRMVVNFQG